MRRLSLGLLVASALVMGSGCAAHSGVPHLTGTPITPDAVYPGDRVAVKVWDVKEMNDTFTVARTGEVILPRLGSISAGGRDPGVLEDSLRRAYTTFFEAPSVEVILLRRVGVHGAVESPDLYHVDLTMTLRDVVARAGGLTDAGDPKDITVQRGERTFRVRASDGGAIPAVLLRSGDQVVVGRRNWVTRNPVATLGTVTGLLTFAATVLIPLLSNE